MVSLRPQLVCRYNNPTCGLLGLYSSSSLSDTNSTLGTAEPIWDVRPLDGKGDLSLDCLVSACL